LNSGDIPNEFLAVVIRKGLKPDLFLFEAGNFGFEFGGFGFGGGGRVFEGLDFVFAKGY